MRPRYRTSLLVVATCGMLTLSGCGADDPDTDGNHDGHGSQHADSDHPDATGSATDALPADTPELPSDDVWAAIGLSCETFDAANFDEQTVEICIGADTQVATMVRLAVQDDHVVAWSYTGLPTVPDVDLSAAHQEVAASVFEILNPADAALLGQLASGGEIAGANWNYEGETKPLPGGGYSSFGIDAKNAESAADVLPLPDSFELDLQDVADTIGDTGAECTVDDGMWTVMSCDVGDFTATMTTDPAADNQVRGLAFTSFAASSDYAAQGAEFVGLLKQTGSSELGEIADQLASQWSTGGPKWTWIEGLPMLIIPMDSGGPFSVDGALVPPLG